MEITVVTTTPFGDQKPGTSGLRKPVSTFQQENYTENFVQSTFNAIGDQLFGRTLVVGGDGRYFMPDAIKIIVQIAAANKVGKLIIGLNGILSTPAVSCLIRKKKAVGGIILTASHNPGGKDGDFGIKYNTSNGGPAPESVTDAIYENTKEIKSYQMCKELSTIDITKSGFQSFKMATKAFHVDVVDPVREYTTLLKNIFDFSMLKKFLSSGEFKVVANGMNGVTGPYITRVICQELDVPDTSIINAEPKEDFGGIHPDPNMTYAADFVELMKKGEFHLGAAFDGDGDRNMVLGHNAFYVNPSDSVAVIAANSDCIPFFKKSGLKGLARSMPTSGALDRVAESLKVKCYEVPTGWKYFGNLMDSGNLSLCGEESFGTGSDHIREKDGIWALLAWLSIVANKKKSVQEIMEEHWEKYGRNYFTRYDYEHVTSDAGNLFMTKLRELASNKTLKGGTYGAYVVDDMDDFRYEDPIDKSITENQGIRVLFTDGSRIIYRLSGTGSQGATIRIYIDSYVDDTSKVKQDAQETLKPLIDIALQISNLESLTERKEPTVIT